MFVLSDMISRRISPSLTTSPSCFFHSMISPSCISTPSLGIIISKAIYKIPRATRKQLKIRRTVYFPSFPLGFSYTLWLALSFLFKTSVFRYFFSNQQFHWIFNQMLQINHEFGTIHTIYNTVVNCQAETHDWTHNNFTINDNRCLNSC